MRLLALVIGFVAAACVADAQTFELGGRIAAGCGGSDGSMCGGGTSPLVGAHASLWADDRIELSASVARVNRSSFDFEGEHLGMDNPVDYSVTDRSRDFISLMFVYHFLKGQPVRPMLGIGSGWYADAQRVTCQP